MSQKLNNEIQQISEGGESESVSLRIENMSCERRILHYFEACQVSLFSHEYPSLLYLILGVCALFVLCRLE